MSLVLNLVRDYGDFKIEIARWEIADRGVTALWGPSGAGKTSVFRLLLGLEPCPGLEWRFGDLNIASLPIPERRLGVVFQSLELFPHMSGFENVLFAARARRIPDAEEKVRDMMKELDLESVRDRRAAVLSGGERQRVALARALVGEPRFLFLDEPFSALDAELRQGARDLVRRVVSERDLPTLLITHDPEDVAALAHTTVRIEGGRFVE